MKRLIKKILKEEFSHPQQQKFLDGVVNSLLSSIYISPSSNLISFGSVGEMEDLGIFKQFHHPIERLKIADK